MNLQKLIYCENNFATAFANIEERPYGRLFYNTENRESHDSNHALILNLDANLSAAIDDIIHFYRERSITPRVYQSFQPGEKGALFPTLQEKGFAVSEWTNNEFLCCDKPSVIVPHPELRIKRVRAIDPGICEIIHSEDEGDWTIKVLERHVAHENFYLFIGYIGKTAVTMASLKVMDGFSRVDDMITHTNHRCNGYGRARMHHLVNFHRKISGNLLYLYSVSPSATRMYMDAGFVLANNPLEYWSAWMID